MTQFDYTTVWKFWFEELTPEEWFKGGERLDKIVKDSFSKLHCAVSQGECWRWRECPQGLLSEIIVLDQFSRNMFRGEARAFAQDGQALTLAQFAVAGGDDLKVSERERQFFYMPYMHSESKLIHEEAILLFKTLGSEENLKYEIIHKEIIDRFGRYPHRNAQLNRDSTAEEIQFLAEESKDFFKS